MDEASVTAPGCLDTPAAHIEVHGADQEWHATVALGLDALVPPHDGGSRRPHELAEELLAEQADFLNALWSAEPGSVYALRLTCDPVLSAPLAGTVAVTLFGRYSAPTAAAARRGAEALGEGLRLLCDAYQPDAAWRFLTAAEEFNAVWQPFPWAGSDFAEVCRRAELVDLEWEHERPGFARRGAGGHTVAGATTPASARRADALSRADRPADDDLVFVVHPFVPRPSTWERLLRILLYAPHPTSLTVALTPTRLSEAEMRALLQEAGKCERALAEAGERADTVHAAYAEALRRLLMEQFARLSDAPLLMRVVLASPCPLPLGLADAVAVELTAPVGFQGGMLRDGSTALLQAGGYDLVIGTLQPGADGDLSCDEGGIPSLSAARPEAGLTHAAPTGGGDPRSRLRRLVDGHEAAGAFRLPLATMDGLPGLDVRTARHRPAPREVVWRPAGDGVHLGESRHGERALPVYVSELDRLQHMYVVGQTGTGKTTMLKHMIVDDIRAGKGLAVIDPHGDLSEEIIACITPERAEDLVIIDPSDMERPVGLNLLECPSADDRYFIVREMRAIMERLLEDQYAAKQHGFSGPVFYQHLQMNMLLAMSDPDDPGTLLQFYAIFQSDDFWRRWLPLKWTDPLLDRWVNESLPNQQYTQRARGEASVGEYLSSKFDDFVFDPMLRAVFGQKRSTVDLLDVMDSGKILVVNLAKGKLTEANARFLGMVLMALLQAAAMKRMHVPRDQRRPFYVYVDEFQSLATRNFALLLSEARKFGVGLVLANQFVTQIDDRGIIDAIFGNVGTLCAFRVGRKDAEELEPQFAPHFRARDLANLPNWEACVRTTVNGQVTAPFSVSTVVRADAQQQPALTERVRELARQRYGRPRDVVQQEIEASLQKRPRSRVADQDPGPLSSDQATALEQAAESLVRALPDAYDETLVRALINLGEESIEASRLHLARSCYELAGSLASKGSDQRSESIAWTGMAKVEARERHFGKAIAAAERALALDRLIGDEGWEKSDAALLKRLQSRVAEEREDPAEPRGTRRLAALLHDVAEEREDPAEPVAPDVGAAPNLGTAPDLHGFLPDNR